ncbi:ABC transporter permease [Paenibacillus aurantiacus]|uniref:ABC transporter permease n=1 Tax=Paenibacillus aurantiacus TaxID=1936118 RepID=A0ABV5KY96_9BACL
MRAYLEIVKISIRDSFAYKFDTFVGIFTNLFFLATQVLLWKALLEYSTSINTTLVEMALYLIIGRICITFYIDSVAYQVGHHVMEGSIAMELIKPYYYSMKMFCISIGMSISSFVVKSLPLVIIIPILTSMTDIEIPLGNLLLFAVALPLNMMMYWLMSYIIGLLHFILINAGWFVRILNETIAILGGAVIPLWYFPGAMQAICAYLPFQLLYQFPQSLIINKITNEEILRNFLLQLCWIGVFGIVAGLLWQFGKKRLIIQGG